jgi:hypothetical protein
VGTNYYLIKPEGDPCEHCGRFDEEQRWHIGKSSGGWCFGLHVLEDYESPTGSTIDSLEKWKPLLYDPQFIIQDEYGATILPDDMIDTIINRSWNKTWKERVKDPYFIKEYGTEAEWHRRNYSERGPNGLVRSKVDGHHCISHGDGTWDMIKGYFS